LREEEDGKTGRRSLAAREGGDVATTRRAPLPTEEEEDIFPKRKREGVLLFRVLGTAPKRTRGAEKCSIERKRRRRKRWRRIVLARAERRERRTDRVIGV
tara:strand:- start:380 stop:679 length:300 start_codon:yes stop_codon:yes gene_type:complete